MNRKAFTLTELTIVLMVIAILASTLLFAMAGWNEKAKIANATVQVLRIHQCIQPTWDSYRTRPVRLRNSATGDTVPPSVRSDVRTMAAFRLTVIRDLQRMELPDRITDVADGATRIPTAPVQYIATTTPVTTMATPKPTVSMRYWQFANSNAHPPGQPTMTGIEYWTETYEGAECLWLILRFHASTGGERCELADNEHSGDIDDDGMPEVLDAWGHPIEWLRWAPGYGMSPGADGAWGAYKDNAGNEVDDDGIGAVQGYREYGWAGSDDVMLVTPMDRDVNTSPDPFNPMRVQPPSPVDPDEQPRGFALYPLVYSAGPDAKYDVNKLAGLSYRDLPMPCDPYYDPVGVMDYQVGTALDADDDGEINAIDNITNHYQPTR